LFSNNSKRTTNVCRCPQKSESSVKVIPKSMTQTERKLRGRGGCHPRTPKRTDSLGIHLLSAECMQVLRMTISMQSSLLVLVLTPFFLGLLFKEPSGSAQDIPNLQVLRTKLFAFATSRASLSLAFGGDVFPVLAFYLIVLVLYVVFIVK